MPKYVEPDFRKNAFNCPRCGAFANQTWYTTFANPIAGKGSPGEIARNLEESYLNYKKNIGIFALDHNDRANVIDAYESKATKDVLNK